MSAGVDPVDRYAALAAAVGEPAARAEMKRLAAKPTAANYSARTLRVLAELRQAAFAKAPCPTNAEMAELLGVPGASLAAMIAALVRGGDVRMEYANKGVRRVTAGGHRTGWTHVARTAPVLGGSAYDRAVTQRLADERNGKRYAGRWYTDDRRFANGDRGKAVMLGRRLPAPVRGGSSLAW